MRWMLVEWLVESSQEAQVHSMVYVGAKRWLGIAGWVELD